MNTSKNKILSLFTFIKDILLSPKYYGLNEANKVVKYDIAERMQQAEKRLLDSDADVITIDNGVKSPETILREWRIFDHNFDGYVSDGYKLSYKLLIDQTLAFINSIMSLPIGSKQKDELPSKAADKEGVDEKLARLTKSRESLKKEIERQEAKEPKDEIKIQSLKAQLMNLDSEYRATLESKKKIVSDTVVGHNISNEVTEAFEKLKAYTK